MRARQQSYHKVSESNVSSRLATERLNRAILGRTRSQVHMEGQPLIYEGTIVPIWQANLKGPALERQPWKALKRDFRGSDTDLSALSTSSPHRGRLYVSDMRNLQVAY